MAIQRVWARYFRTTGTCGYVAALLAFLSVASVVAAQNAPLPGAMATDTAPQPSRRWDGTWAVNIDCADVKEGAQLIKGYVYRFIARVEDGVMHGEHGVAGASGSLTLDGRVGDDGNADLVAKGLTGDPSYNAGRVARSLPYTYRIKATFDLLRGDGHRVDVRPCKLAFVRQ